MTQTYLLKLGIPCKGSTALKIPLLTLACSLFFVLQSTGQVNERHAFAPADTFHKGRFWLVAGVTAATYTGTVIGFNTIWYRDYPRSGFHTFNDWGEWENIDKMGHMFTAYFESEWCYALAKWTGIPERDAQWVGAGMGVLLQSTIEVMDGFSEQWGFSVPDFAFNIMGSGTFLAQQRMWGEQRIRLKISGTRQSYPTTPVHSIDGEHSTTLRDRVNSLYGSEFFERMLKDYNAQTSWISVNIASFIRKENSRFPTWLNIAAGYGAANMYGGFDNTWNDDGVHYALDDNVYPRLRQYYLSPDIDLTKIPSKNPFVRTLLAMVNVFKIPAPTLEINSRGGVTLHPVSF